MTENAGIETPETLYPELPPPVPQTPSLRERIDAALGESSFGCARCQHCDRQIDAMLGVVSAEVARLRQALWDCYRTAGSDPDGDSEAPPPGARTPDVPELALQAVRELRHDYRETLERPEPMRRDEHGFAASFTRAAGVTEAAGAKVRAARESAGLTQEALSRALGVTQTCVSYWEAGKRDMGVADLMRVAEALGVHAASLLPCDQPGNVSSALIRNEGKLARVEVKGFRDLGIVRVTESTLAGEPMLRAEGKDGAVAEFPASSLHFITWLPEGAELTPPSRAAIPAGWGDDDDYAAMPADSGPF